LQELQNFNIFVVLQYYFIIHYVSRLYYIINYH
jgi:hypothetical protein